MALVLLGVLIAPAASLRIGQADVDSLTTTGPAREVLSGLRDGGVGTGVLTPIEVLVPAEDAPAAAAAA